MAEREGFIFLCKAMFHNDVLNRSNICTIRIWQKDSNPVQSHSVEPALRWLGSGRRRVLVHWRHHRLHPGPLMPLSRRQRTKTNCSTYSTKSRRSGNSSGHPRDAGYLRSARTGRAKFPGCHRRPARPRPAHRRPRLRPPNADIAWPPVARLARLARVSATGSTTQA